MSAQNVLMGDPIEEIETEYREAVIIICPSCTNEFEENSGAFKYGTVFQCNKCRKRWINTLDFDLEIVMNKQEFNRLAAELLPCPFCGAAPVFPESKDVFGTFYDAGCEECGIATISLQIIDCFDRPRDHVHDSWNKETYQYGLEYIDVARKQAIEMWNTRTNPDEPVQKNT